jgi:hypothetical protein
MEGLSGFRSFGRIVGRVLAFKEVHRVLIGTDLSGIVYVELHVRFMCTSCERVHDCNCANKYLRSARNNREPQS